MCTTWQANGQRHVATLNYVISAILLNEAKDDASEGLSNVNETGISPEVNNKNSCELDVVKLNALNSGEM